MAILESRRRLRIALGRWAAGCLIVSSGLETEGRAQLVASSVSALKKLSVEQLMDIDVTSVSRRPEKLLATASAIQVVTGDDIRRSTAASIPEALRLADNLDVAQKNSHDWGIAARGFNTELTNKLLVMIDGRTIYTPLFSGVFWNVQDYLLEDIDQIEVISGPGGTLWGANAVNGVINITTKSTKETTGVYLEGGGGGVFNHFGGGRYGGTLAPGVTYRVYGKYFDRSHEVLANGTAVHDAWRRSQGGFRVDADAGTANTFTFQGDYYSGRDEAVAGGESRVRGSNLLARWSRTFSPDSDLRLQVYHDRTHLDLPVPAFVLGNGAVLAPAGRLRDDLDTWDVDFQHRFRSSARHEFIWGLGFRHTDDEVTNAPALAFFPPQLTQKLYSGFLQDEIALADKLSLTLGTKLEHYDYTGVETEPSLRLQWNLAADRLLWAAVSRAVRTPSRIDRDLSQPAAGLVVLKGGGADYQSEKVVAWELGYRAQLGPQATFSASAFYNDYDDVRSTSTTPRTIVPFFFANNLAGESYGLEFSGDYQVREGWRMHAGYTALKTRLHVKPGQADLNNALNEISDPEHRVSLRSSLDLSRATELDVAWRWIDARSTHSGPTPGTTSGYNELDARFAWRLTPGLELAIVGQNLLHRRHVEYGYPTPNRVEIARSVMGKGTWRF